MARTKKRETKHIHKRVRILHRKSFTHKRTHTPIHLLRSIRVTNIHLYEDWDRTTKREGMSASVGCMKLLESFAYIPMNSIIQIRVCLCTFVKYHKKLIHKDTLTNYYYFPTIHSVMELNTCTQFFRIDNDDDKKKPKNKVWATIAMGNKNERQ